MKPEQKPSGLIKKLCQHFFADTYPIYQDSDHYNAQTQTFYNPEPQRPVKDMFSAFGKMIFQAKRMHPPGPLPMQTPDWTAFNATDKSHFIWFGHSTLFMHIGHQTILTDPLFGQSLSPIPNMMKRFQPPPAALSSLPEIDVVTISHSHYDHLEKASIQQLAQRNNHFVVSLGLGVILQKWGITATRITELDWWQSTTINDITYTAVPSRHNSGRGLFDGNKTLWSTFVIEYKDERYYFGSDTAYGKHFDDIAKRFTAFDIVFIENGQYNERWPDNHLFPEQTAEVTAKLNTRRFVPVHWGAFPLSTHSWNDSVVRSTPIVRQLGVHPLTPILGQVFDVDTLTKDWFTAI